MLCENCQQRVASVHLSGWRRKLSESGGEERVENFEHHFCETCATELKESSPLLNPALSIGPGAQTEKLRVISVSSERTVVRLVRTEVQGTPEDWSFVTSRLPPKYAVVGMEFEMVFTEAWLERLKGII